MIARIVAALLALAALPVGAGELPPGAVRYMPLLKEEITTRWPDLPLPSALAAQVEQETCISLSSRGCWNPRTELKTSREYGFGLGQLTVTSRFNAFTEVLGMDDGLRGWKWADRYDPRLQLRALVVKDRANAHAFRAATPSPNDRLAFALAAYNGGIGGTLSDIRLCARTHGCDPTRWFGHVERTSLKSRTKLGGYGQSFFDINRTYVHAVLVLRRPKYVRPMEGET